MNIRPMKAADLVALKTVVDDTELFPSEMLPDMAAGYFAGEEVQDIWLTCEREGQPIGLCYTVPEQLADGAWNMLAICVSPALQGSGAGGAMTAHLETMLREKGARLLLADTSGTDTFAATRKFYAAKGYTEEARIRDFWEAGDDKVTFTKAL